MSFKQFKNEPKVDTDRAFMITEMTLDYLSTNGEIDEFDFTSRADLLGALGQKVMVTNCSNHQKLINYLAERDSGLDQQGLSGYYTEDGEIDGGAETIDFEDLSPELQYEFQLVNARANEELGPLALERAIQMQRIVQAETYTERLNVLRECVDNERRRLEAKKMLQSLALNDGGKDEEGEMFGGSRTISREEARSIFERLMSSHDAVNQDDPSNDAVGGGEEAFQ